MRHHRGLVLMTLMLVSAAFAYFETDMPNLQVPSNLKPGVLGLDIEHRLMPKLAGANVILGLRYCVWSRLELKAAYGRRWDVQANELDLGSSYACHWSRILRAQADVQFSAFKRDDTTAIEQSFLGLLSLQSEPLWGVLTPVANLGYDGETRRLGAGAGLNLGFRWGFGPIDRLDFGAEYSPWLSRSGSPAGRVRSFAGSLSFETYGHHFAFMLGNNLQPGSRGFLSGAQTNSLHFGFNIHRFLDLKSF